MKEFSHHTALLRLSLMFVICFGMISSPAFAAEEVTLTQADLLVSNVEGAVENGDYSLAESECVNAIEQHPGSAVELAARRELAKLNIMGGNIQAASEQIEIIRTNFSAHPDTAETLLLIAKQWTSADHPNKALDLHIYNSQAYPNTHGGMISQVKILRADFQQKNYTAMQKNVGVLIAQFSGQPGLPKEVYKVARQFEQVGLLDQAASLYQYTINHPTCPEYVTKSRMGMFTIEAMDDKDSKWLKNELDLIKTELSDQTGLSEGLWTSAEFFRQKGLTGFASCVNAYNAEQFVGTKYAMRVAPPYNCTL